MNEEKKMIGKRFIISLLALAALALTVADASRAQSSLPQLTEEFHQVYPLSADGRISLSNINGGVRISAWDRNEVKVDAVKRAYTPERLQEARIEVDAGASYVHIETKYPEGNLTWRRNGDDDRRDNPASVEYTLTVPRGASLEEVSLINGGLQIEGLAGSVRASSVNGRVTARGLTGTVNLSVVNGGLDATLDRLNESGTVSLSAVNGSLVVTLPSDANATLRASTVHGAISNDFKLPVREGEYVGRDLEGRLGQGAARVHLSNVNGSISVRRANDNRPPSPVTNLLSETNRDDDQDQDEAREAREEARQEREESRAEAREAAREAQRDREDAAREIQREAARAARDAEKGVKEAAKAAAAIDKEQLKESIRDGVRVGSLRDDSRRQVARESNTFAVTGTPRVRVETFDGAIYVHAWDKPEVMYTATKRADDDREMQGIKLSAQGGGGSEVTLRADFDKSQARAVEERDGRVVSFSSNASAEFDVYVPRSATLIISTGDGRVRVEGVNGDLDVRSGDGAIDVTGARGRLRAETGDGRILVEGFDGDAEARTGDGRITLDGNFRTLAARTGDGTISLAVPDGTNATVETDAESVFNDGVAVAESQTEARVRRWRIGGGGQLFTLHTGDGRVVLRRR
ncbi:MAG: DUF4097 family beta strand repeat-containing protein [Acidobacteriota bacterium]|nr:DUF4097 family beta strand repeat-containing protein [Acidobacteriota bacterium]MDQ5835537.1 DUF4097 family beta strand repeat-containing protein [Acidobacteriota bacterium]